MNRQTLLGNTNWAGEALTIEFPNGLQVSIRPKDRNGLDSLMRYAGRQVDVRDLVKMIPDIRELRFTQIEWGGDFSRGEWFADATLCRVNIQAPPLSDLGHQDSMHAWRELMAQLGGS